MRKYYTSILFIFGSLLLVQAGLADDPAAGDITLAGLSTPDGDVPCGADGICNLAVCDDDPDCPKMTAGKWAELFELRGTGASEDGKRKLLKSPVELSFTQPDGAVETRRFNYSTPRNYKNRAANSVNLWLVLHGRMRWLQGPPWRPRRF